MDDKIEAWVRNGKELVNKRATEAHLRGQLSDLGPWNECGEYGELLAHLRTTPEGFRLVPVEPTEAMLQAEIDAVSDYWFDHEELGNRTEATKIGYKAMLAASQESGT